jgi:hypothetical protein
MSHKTKEQRRQEAKERNRPMLKRHEQNLLDAVDYASRNPHDRYAAQCVSSYTYALTRAYLECGYETMLANGVVSAILEQRPLGSRLSSSIKHDTIVRLSKPTVLSPAYKPRTTILFSKE